MSDTARDYQIVDAATTDGMDELFDGSELGSVTQNQVEEPGSEPCGTSAVEIVSTDEAARRLGISARAVIKRLKTGSMQGFRDESKPRAEWRIYWKELGSELGGTGSFERTFHGTAEPAGSFKGTSNGTKEPVGSSESIQEQQALANNSFYVFQLNKQLLEQLQELTHRNGYLESQLTEREKDIAERDEKMKLLTDSQHKPGWWTKFSAWFFKIQ
jgi:hypothetical protein